MDSDLRYILENVVLPLGAIFMTFGLPLLAFVCFRILAHRERMAMIRNGLLPVADPSQKSGFAVPRWKAFSGAGSAEPAQATLNKGIRLAFIGLALIIGLSFTTSHSSDSGASWRLGPWLLIGLVPMFIGIAQILIAMLSGAGGGLLSNRFGPRSEQSAPFVPQAPPGPAPAIVPEPFDYRPDPLDYTFGNLPPVPPKSGE